MGIFVTKSWRGGISDYEDKGLPGSFKDASNIDIRKLRDTLSAQQALVDEGTFEQSPSQSPSASLSPSSSNSPSPSLSVSPSASASPSGGGTASLSPSSSRSPSSSASPSASLSPSSSISTSPSPSAGLQTVFSDLIRSFVKCSDGNLYGFGNTGKVYKRVSFDQWYQVYDLHKPIIGACEKPSSGGKLYILFATRTEIHRKEIPGNSGWNDVDAAGTVQGDTWPKTNLDPADWHTMAQVGGDVLITNGSKLAMSAYDDSYTNEALDLIPGNVAETLIERSGRAVIGTFRASDPTTGVNAMIDTEVPLAQIGNDGYLYYNDFKNSISIKRFPGGGKVNPGGVCNEVSQAGFFDWAQTALSWIDKQNVGNMAVFAVYNADVGKGGLYTYGRRNKNQPFVMNRDYQFDADELGAVTNMAGVNIVSYRTGSTFGVKSVDQTNKATFTVDSLDLAAPVKYSIQLTTWKQIELYMYPLPANTALQVWYRMDKFGNFLQARTADGQLQYTKTNGKKAVFSIVAEGEIYEYRIIGIPYRNITPEIYRVKTLFS